MPPPKRQSRLKEKQHSGFTACVPAVASAHLTSAAAALAGRCVGPSQRTAVWGQSYSFIFMSLILVFCLLFRIKPHIFPFPFAGVPALCPGVPVARGLRTAQQRGAWRTGRHLSCPATQQTPPRMCCSGSWKVNGKAGISLTGKPKCPGFKTGVILVHKLDTLLNFSFPPAQQPEHQEILRGLLHPDAHVGWRWKLWPPAQPPARPAVHPGPSHASSTSPQHSGPAGGGLPPTGGGLHQDHQATVHRHQTVGVLDRRDS